MVIPTALARFRGIRQPVISAGSARIFEPGFMTERIPGRAARYFASWNVGHIVRLLGVRPIEDHPLARPLASWAYLIFRHFGNLPLRVVFDSRYLPTALPMGARLSSCWSARHVRALRQEVTISALMPEFRTWVREHLRQQVEADLGVFLDLLEQGHAVYTTPEGRFSEDGRLNRFRKSLDLMREKARHVTVAGVSYDLLRPGKLTMWVQFEEPRWPDRLDRSVIAARPVTASHLVIRAWLAGPHVSASDVIIDAKALMNLVRERAVVASDVLADPDRALAIALREFGRRSAHGTRITDPRFPFVNEFVVYYNNQWLELMTVLDQTAWPKKPQAL